MNPKSNEMTENKHLINNMTEQRGVVGISNNSSKNCEITLESSDIRTKRLGSKVVLKHQCLW